MVVHLLALTSGFTNTLQVIVNFILTCPNLGLGPREHEDMVPVLADLFQFSDADRTRVLAAQEKARNKSIIAAASDFLWNPLAISSSR